MTTPRLDVDRLLSLGRVTAAVPSPDGTWLAVAVQRLDSTGARFASDLWRVSVTAPSAPPIQLTRGDCRDGAPAFRRDGALAFLSNRNPRAGEPDQDDDKRNQVWMFPTDGGEPRPLTDEPLGVDAFKLAADGDRLIVIAPVLLGVPHDKQRETAAARAKYGPSALHYKTTPIRMWDHWLPEAAPHVIAYDERGNHRRDLTPDADREHREQWFDVQFDVSPDGARVAVRHTTLGADRLEDGAWKVIDVADGTSRILGGGAGADYTAPMFSPDGKRLACTRHMRSTESAGCERVRIFDVASGDEREIAADWDSGPMLQCWTPDGAALIAVAMENGFEPVYRIDAKSGERTRITAESAGGCHGSVHVTADGTAIVGTRNAILHPPEPFRADLTANATPVLLGCLSGLSPEEGAMIARWESFTVRADDGASVQSFLVMPASHKDGDPPLPGLMNIHGGPIGHHADTWHWRWNALAFASAGYAVTMPNPRGSTGFGQAYIDGIWKNRWGAECYTDLMKVADWMEQHPAIDAARIGAAGGSFGGYMANWIGGQTDRFQCLITHASLFAMSQFHGPTDVPPWLLLEMGCSPYDDPEAFDRYSPHRFVKNWKTPALVIHGEKDYRVPISEGLTLFEALQLHGVESELLVFPDENHWILKPNNVRAWYRVFLEFAGRYLRPEV